MLLNVILGLAIGAEEGQKEDGGMHRIGISGEAFAHQRDIITGYIKKDITDKRG